MKTLSKLSVICIVIVIIDNELSRYFFHRRRDIYIIDSNSDDCESLNSDKSFNSRVNLTSLCQTLRSSGYYPFDIDFVYTWVTGSDPKWKESLNKHRRIQKQVSNLANDEIRFVGIEELRYSLRTVEKYAPFVRFIFIVTCGQIPNWINQEHPKVRFIQQFENVTCQRLIQMQ